MHPHREVGRERLLQKAKKRSTLKPHEQASDPPSVQKPPIVMVRNKCVP